MTELNKLICKIKELRKELNTLILEKQDLLDPDVIAASKKLDDVLNEYNNMKKKKQLLYYSCKSSFKALAFSVALPKG